MSSIASLHITGPPAKGPAWAERIFGVIVLLYSSGAFFPLLQGERDPSSGAPMGTALTNAIWVLIYIIAFLLLRSIRFPFEEIRRNLPFIVLIGLPCLSIMWSTSPLLTFLHVAALIGTAIVSMYLAFRFSTRELLTLCIWALGIAGIGSVFMAIFVPGYGISTDSFEGVWVGVYGQKNSFGAAMAIGFLAALLLLRFTKSIRLRYVLFSGFMLSLVYLSDSMTSLVICLVSPLLLWGAQVIVVPSPRVLWRKIGIMLSAAILVAVLVFHFEGATNAFGRNETFTGRTTIWALVMQAILERPLLGYGYEAYWQSYEGPSGELWEVLGQPFSNSHNGFLEMWLGVGLLGLLVVGLTMAVLFGRAFRGMSRRFCLDTVWPLMFLCYLFLSNLTEATLLHANILATALLLTILSSYSHEFSWRRSQHWQEP